MLKSLKSLFIVEEDPKPGSKKTSAPKKAASPAPSKSSKTVAGPVKSESASGKKGKVSSKFMDTLLGAMDQANLEGFDYLEYKKSMQSLKKMSMDAATIYQSAFAMAQTMGATPQKLVESAQYYVDILEKEESKFEVALAHQQKTKIGSKQKQHKDLQASIKKSQAEIKKLQESIQKNETQLKTLDKEIQGAVNRVESTKNDFIATYNQLVSQITTDIENMKKHLK